MKPIVKVDTREFHAALRQFLATTSREINEAVRARMFFVLVRAFTLIKPMNPQAERNRVRQYLNEPVGERRFDKKTGKHVGRSRMLQRRHLIVQAKQKKAGLRGLYGDEMKKAAGAFSRQAIGSIGYLKAGVAKAIKAINGGSFSQFGGRTKKAGGTDISPNAALVKIANEYGHAMNNVALHKGARSYAFVTDSKDLPTAVADMAWNIKEGQEGNVGAVVNPAFQRAFDDEVVEMRKRIAIRLQAAANEHNVKPQTASA